jgi:hypothetical protein
MEGWIWMGLGLANTTREFNHSPILRGALKHSGVEWWEERGSKAAGMTSFAELLCPSTVPLLRSTGWTSYNRIIQLTGDAADKSKNALGSVRWKQVPRKFEADTTFVLVFVLCSDRNHHHRWQSRRALGDNWRPFDGWIDKVNWLSNAFGNNIWPAHEPTCLPNNSPTVLLTVLSWMRWYGILNWTWNEWRQFGSPGSLPHQ